MGTMHESAPRRASYKMSKCLVDNDEDIDDEIYCESNLIDECGDCDGENLCIGCSDPEACNYSELITIDNGSCYYIEPYYDCEGNCLLDSDFDGVCNELEIPGCVDLGGRRIV